MPEITKRRLGEFIRGVLQVLENEETGLRAAVVIERLAQIVPPSEFERQEYPNRPGTRRYEKTVRFATIIPVKAGWLLKSRGRWMITPAGAKALREYPDPERLYAEAYRLYREWVAARDETAGPGREKESEPEDVDLPAEADEADVAASSAIENAEGLAWEQIEAHLCAMDPYDVQRLVAGLLKGMGYHVAWLAPPGPDLGIDILAHPDPLGAREPTIKVSVRRRAQASDVRDLREFLALLHPSEVGIFVSLGGFTRAAEDLARQEQRRIRLLDVERFFHLWVEHYSRVPDKDRRLFPIRPVWFLDRGKAE